MTATDHGSTALLVMDVQAGIADPFEGTGTIERIAGAADAARAAGIPVVHVTVGFRPGGPEISPRNAGFAALRDAGRIPGETPEIHPAVAPREGEVVVRKKRYSAFTGSDLAVVLRGLGVGHLVLSGFVTSGVVLSTLREAADLDFGLVVLADGTGDPDDEVHRVLTEKVFPKQARVIDTATWVADLPG